MPPGCPPSEAKGRPNFFRFRIKRRLLHVAEFGGSQNYNNTLLQVGTLFFSNHRNRHAVNPANTTDDGPNIGKPRHHEAQRTHRPYG